MELLSVTNKKTQLHKSPSDLTIACTQEHNQKRAVSSDISVFSSSAASKCFVQINKSDVVEIWRIKPSSDGNQFLDRLRKTKADGIQAISCNKNKDSAPEYAVGFTSGQIKVVELNSKNTCRLDFPADPNSKASVVSLDFSNCGGYLASVLENGLINIYGLTTKVKTDQITFDKESTIARFHPGKRFQLAVASYNGCVTIYDMSVKRISFQERNAHEAPCRDLAMPEDIPNRLFSCGCDSVIKIFDTRKKSTGLQIQSYCGFTTIAVTNCGGLFAVGNLKGDLLTYDMRNLGQPLAKMKVDNELITRVAFVPNYDESAQMETISLRDSSEARFSDELPDPPIEQHDFTIYDAIGFQQGRVSDFDMSCSSRVSAISSRAEPGKRSSDAFAQKWGNALNELSFTTDSLGDVQCDSPDGRKSEIKGAKKESLPKRRSSFKPQPLQLILEECGKENLSSSINVGTPNGTGGPRFSSTPAVRLITATPVPSENSEDIIDVDALESPKKKDDNDASSNKVSATIVQPSFALAQNVDFKKEFEVIQEKIRFEVQSLGLDLSMRHFEAISHAYDQRRHIENRMKTIEDCVGLLMNEDVKINRIMELQDENRELRQQMNDLMRRADLN